MSEDKQEDPSHLMRRDSRLKTFLRRASAIIAAEKGLNSFARAKLDDLAQSLKLPDELFQVGLGQLQSSNAPVVNLTDYEEAFLKFLAREFSQKRPGDVLAISIEEKAIAHANSRYGIVAQRAEQLIDYQANQSGMGRLSRSDAREFGQQMILDLVGDRLSFEGESQNKVDRIGRRWGCDPAEVRQLIEGRIRENRAARSRAKRRPWGLGAITLIGLLAMGLGGKWVHDNFDRVFGGNVAVAVQDRPTDVVPAADFVETKSDLELAFADLAEKIASEDPSVRGEAMALATERVLEGAGRVEAQKKAIGRWFLAEPSPIVASSFLQTIETFLNASPETRRNGALEGPYRAASLAGELCDSEAASSGKILLLRRLLEKKVGADSRDEAPSESTIFAAIAARQWNQLIERAYHVPARCSILVEPLAELTASKLPALEQQQFLSRAVRTIILADPAQWRNMEEAILSAIRASDEVQRMEWTDIWLDEFDGALGFREFAADALLAGVPQSPDPFSNEAEARLRADRSAWRNRKFEKALLRQSQIQARVQQLEPFLGSTALRGNPDLVYQANLMGNLCLEAMAIMESGRASQESAWRDVDAQLQRFDLRLREFVFLENQAAGNVRISSAGFDTTLRDRTVKTLSDLSEKNQPLRLAAIERLPKLTEKFRSIPQPLARSLASYIVAPHDADEYLQLQRVLPAMLAWPEVVLSVSDQLVKSQAAEEQLQTSFALLTDGLQDPSLSKEAMALTLLELSHELLVGKEEVDPNSAASDWLRLKSYLQQSYWQRASLLTKNPSLPNGSLLENLRQAVIAMADRPRTAQRAIELIERVSENELEQVVLLNQLLLRSNAQPPLQTLGVRLLQTELALLQKWNDQRQRQLKGLVDGF